MKKTILVVDDFQSNLIFIKQVLSDIYDVAIAASGEQALKYLRTNIPDLIILDIWMPEMDGIETLQRIREAPRGASIPVLFLTSQADVNNVLKGYELGVKDVLAKPIEPNAMKDRLKRVFLEEQNPKARVSENASVGIYSERHAEEIIDGSKEVYKKDSRELLFHDVDNGH